MLHVASDLGSGQQVCPGCSPPITFKFAASCTWLWTSADSASVLSKVCLSVIVLHGRCRMLSEGSAMPVSCHVTPSSDLNLSTLRGGGGVRHHGMACPWIPKSCRILLTVHGGQKGCIDAWHADGTPEVTPQVAFCCSCLPIT